MNSSNPAETAPTSRATPATSSRNLVRMERTVNPFIVLEHLARGLEGLGRQLDLEPSGDLLVDDQLRARDHHLDAPALAGGQPVDQLADLVADGGDVGSVAR